MPQGSSAWVWMSIATTSSMLGSFNFAIWFPAPDWMFGKLIIRYNKFGKPAGRHAAPVEAKAAAAAGAADGARFARPRLGYAWHARVGANGPRARPRLSRAVLHRGARGVPVICPTRQNVSRAKHPCRRPLLLCMGLFSIFWLGGRTALSR